MNKEIKFCLTVIMDTTGSMSSSIESAKNNIKRIFDNLEKIQRDNNIPDGEIVGQVIQYKDYSERNETDNRCSITSDIDDIKRRLDGFDADGGGDCGLCNGWCEDMHYGVECALNNMEESPYKDYAHLMLIVGDYCCHGDDPNTICGKRDHPFLHVTIRDLWPLYFERMKRFENLQIKFIPIDSYNIRYTYDRFKCYDGLNVTCENCINGNESGMTIKRITEDYMKKLIENNYFYLLQQTQHIINNITQLNIKRINFLFVVLMNNITFQFQSSC